MHAYAAPAPAALTHPPLTQVVTRAQMLPVVAAAAAGTGLLLQRRRRWLRAKPQRRFRLQLADNSNAAFVHLQRGSSAAAAPSASAGLAASDDSAQPSELVAAEQQEHPYAPEIQVLLQHPQLPAALAPGSALAGPPPPLSATPLVWVHTPRQLAAMLAALQGVPAIALDTEHHSQRSYLGVTCLLQLSTGA